MGHAKAWIISGVVSLPSQHESEAPGFGQSK